MQVVGLLSGGKDSCFNLCHCVAHGHEIVALATLAPPEGTGAPPSLTPDELDSYMYQTVGHDAVQAVADAMALPLYRAHIRGTPRNQGAVYGARDPAQRDIDARDETEDLYELLKLVKLHHPHVAGVSVGAILSNYQRVRVEHVCLRPELSLQPLAYLWRRHQPTLLYDMISSGLVAAVIKVAGIGLSDKDLGRTLAQLSGKLERLSDMYGAHMCGEGGEYETLALDSPLFRHALAIRDSEVVVHADAAFASVSYLRVPQLDAIPKHAYGPDVVHNTLPVPKLLDPTSDAGLAAITPLCEHPTTSRAPTPLAPWTPETRAATRDGLTTLAAVHASGADSSLEDEIHAVFTQMHQQLRAAGLDATDIAHVNVYLTSQAHFAALNAIYQAQFGAAPPSRVCIAVPADAGPRIALDVIAARPEPEHERRCLHVQSRSQWAPANIGPYSQAVATHGRIYLAGQIGMEPVTLALPTHLPTQLTLSLQNMRRVVLAVQEWDPHAFVEGGIAWTALPTAFDAAIERLWTTPGSDALHPHSQLPDDTWIDDASSLPLLLAHVDEHGLPKHAALEWQLTMRTPHDDIARTRARGHIQLANGMYLTYHLLDSGTHTAGAAVVSTTPPGPLTSDAPLRSALARAHHAKLLYPATDGAAALHAALEELALPPATTPIPTHGVHLLGTAVQDCVGGLHWL